MTTLSIKLSPWKQTHVSCNIIHFSQFFHGWSLSANSPLRKLSHRHSWSSDSLARFRDENPNMDHSDESKMTDDKTGRCRKNRMIDFYQTEYSLDCSTAGLGVCNGERTSEQLQVWGAESPDTYLLKDEGKKTDLQNIKFFSTEVSEDM